MKFYAVQNRLSFDLQDDRFPTRETAKVLRNELNEANPVKNSQAEARFIVVRTAQHVRGSTIRVEAG